MNHATAWTLLDRFLDCALDAETRWTVAAHLGECNDCQAYLAEQAQMRTLVRNRLAPVTAPRRLAGRIHTAIRDAGPAQAEPRRFDPGRLSLLVAALAVLLVMVLPTWLATSSAPRLSLAAELATPHLLFAQDDTLLEVTGNPESIQAWFSSKVPFLVATPTLPGFELQGGRLISVAGRRAAQVIYERESAVQYVSLVYYDAPPGDAAGLKPSGPFGVGQYARANVVTWVGSHSRVALVGELSAVDLLRLAGQVQTQP